MTKKRQNKKQQNTDTKNQSEEQSKGKETGDEVVENSASENEEIDTEDGSKCQDENQKLEEQVADLKDKHLRLFSEFDNFRRRTAKERIELFKTANADLMLDLLPIIDDFDRAIKSFEDSSDAQAIKEGVDLIKNKFTITLEKKGLKCMDSHEKEFDTDFHEAITEIPAPTKKLKSKVVDVIEKGYTLNDKVIRYAKVVVGK